MTGTERSPNDPWDALIESGLALACTSQRFPVLQTGERVLEAVFSESHGLRDKLRTRLLDRIRAVVDPNDEYEVSQLVRVLRSLGLMPVAGLGDWLLASAEPAILEVAKTLPD